MAFFITEDCMGCGLCKRNCPVFAIEGELKALHTINAKRCVECGVCGRVCTKQAVQDAAGNRMARVPKKEWQKPQIDPARCSACAICVEACTPGALQIERPKFHGDIDVSAVLSDPAKCIGCALCSTRCPLGAITMVEPVQKEAV